MTPCRQAAAKAGFGARGTLEPCRGFGYRLTAIGIAAWGPATRIFIVGDGNTIESLYHTHTEGVFEQDTVSAMED